MKSKIFIFTVLLLTVKLTYSQNPIEFERLADLKIVKPTIQNIVKMTVMDFSSWEKNIKLLNYSRLSIEGDMYQYSTGSIAKTGMLIVEKSQVRYMSSFLWTPADGKTTIFDDLSTELAPYFVKMEDQRTMIYEVEFSNGEAFRFALNRDYKGEFLLVLRFK